MPVRFFYFECRRMSIQRNRYLIVLSNSNSFEYTLSKKVKHSYRLFERTDHTIYFSANNTNNVLGFEPSINQRLLPPTFPRYTKIKSRAEAVAYFIKMIERFKQVWKVPNMTSFHQALVNTE